MQALMSDRGLGENELHQWAVSTFLWAAVYLVTQDGLLHQPRVPVQANPRIAPAPHLAQAHGPRSRTCPVVSAKVAASKLTWSSKHSASMSSSNGAEREETKSFQTERPKV